MAGTCPFCGTDVASMPLIEVEAEPAGPPRVTALAVVPKPLPRRRRPWQVLLVFAIAAAAALAGHDIRQVRTSEEPVRLPSVAIPVLTTQPAPARASAESTPSPTVAVVATPGAVTHAAPSQVECDFFTGLEIDRQYAFDRDRADLKLQRAQENSAHLFRIDHDRKAYDARTKAAAGEHAATIAQIDRELSRARTSCDASFLF